MKPDLVWMKDGQYLDHWPTSEEKMDPGLLFYPRVMEFAGRDGKTPDSIERNCPNCGAPRDRRRDECPYCGTPYATHTAYGVPTEAPPQGDSFAVSMMIDKYLFRDLSAKAAENAVRSRLAMSIAEKIAPLLQYDTHPVPYGDSVLVETRFKFRPR